MTSPQPDDRRYQRALVAAINAELGGRGWTRKRLAAEAGIPLVTLDRVFTLKRDMNVAQFELIANALGVTTDHIVIAAEHWRTGTPPPGQTQSAVPDPRKLIRFLLDHPNQDQVLLTRLSEATGHVGGKGTRMKQLEAEIRSNRSEELTSALAALPSTDRATS